MFADHKIAAAIGSLGAIILLSHVVLGPDIVPPAVGLAGAVPLVAAGLFIAIARRRNRDREPRP